MAAGDSLQGIVSQNKREQVLKGWLAKPPLRCAMLVLVAVGDPPITIAEWQRDEIIPALALDICSRIDEHGEEQGTSCVKFTLTYCTENREPITTKTLQYRRSGTSDESLELARAIEARGSPEAVTSLFAQAFEAHTRMYLTAHQAQMQQSFQLNDRLIAMQDRLMDLLTAERERTQELHREVMQQAADLLGAAQQTEQDGELTEMQRKGVEMLERLLPLVGGALAAKQAH